MDPFLTSLRVTEKAEGGWSNDPNDPGGATMVGVTLRAWRAFMHDESLSPEQLRAMTEDARKVFYRVMYWRPMQCDSLLTGINLMAFDTAVNCGVHASSIILQTAAGMPVGQIDGDVGPKTIAWVKKVKVADLLIQFNKLRLSYFQSLPGFPRYGKGWTARSQRMLAISGVMLENAASSKPTA